MDHSHDSYWRQRSRTVITYYAHDSQHRRTRRSPTGSKYGPAGVYHYDGSGHLIAETTPAGAPLRSYVWRDDVVVAQIEHQPSQTVLYLETDYLGAVRAARNSTGQVVWRWESDAFGATLPSEDPDGNRKTTTVNLRFPGQIADSPTPAVYNWHRYYDPSSGRYVSSDPIGLDGGLNTYLYVGNNPLTRIDPTGLDWIYSQSTGNLSYQSPASQGGAPPAFFASGGYSGNGAGYNNPSMQDIPNVGPIPQGGWTIGRPYNSPKVGPFAIPLTPSPGTNDYGRTDFRIHGDNSCMCGSASEGCVIFNRNVRNEIINSGDSNFIVVP